MKPTRKFYGYVSPQGPIMLGKDFVRLGYQAIGQMRFRVGKAQSTEFEPTSQGIVRFYDRSSEMTLAVKQRRRKVEARKQIAINALLRLEIAAQNKALLELAATVEDLRVRLDEVQGSPMTEPFADDDDCLEWSLREASEPNPTTDATEKVTRASQAAATRRQEAFLADSLLRYAAKYKSPKS
jgi:hypothetical protein